MHKEFDNKENVNGRFLCVCLCFSDCFLRDHGIFWCTFSMLYLLFDFYNFQVWKLSEKIYLKKGNRVNDTSSDSTHIKEQFRSKEKLDPWIGGRLRESASLAAPGVKSERKVISITLISSEFGAAVSTFSFRRALLL